MEGTKQSKTIIGPSPDVVRNLMRQWGVKTRDVAEKSGYTQNYVRFILRGLRNNIDVLEAAVELCELQRARLEELEERVEEFDGIEQTTYQDA